MDSFVKFHLKETVWVVVASHGRQAVAGPINN